MYAVHTTIVGRSTRFVVVWVCTGGASVQFDWLARVLVSSSLPQSPPVDSFVVG